MLKLFVWAEWAPNYTDGLAFAIAETEEQARKLIYDERGFCTTEWGPCQVFDLNTPIAFSVYGGG